MCIVLYTYHYLSTKSFFLRFEVAEREILFVYSFCYVIFLELHNEAIGFCTCYILRILYSFLYHFLLTIEKMQLKCLFWKKNIHKCLSHDLKK